MSTVPLQSKLGCPFRCVYCTYRKIEGEAYRLFDPAEVAAEAAKTASSGLRDIEFVDNVFNAPVGACPAGLRRRCIRAGVSCPLPEPGTESRPVHAMNCLRFMERAGFVGIGLTVESASDPVLQGLGKGFTSRDVHAAADVVARHDLPCVWIFMLGRARGNGRPPCGRRFALPRSRIRPGDAAFFSGRDPHLPGNRARGHRPPARAC